MKYPILHQHLFGIPAFFPLFMLYVNISNSSSFSEVHGLLSPMTAPMQLSDMADLKISAM